MILGTGYYLPKNVVSNSSFPTNWNVTANFGVETRHRVLDETSISMGASAAFQALAQANLQPHDINLIICASSAPQQAIPCSAVLLHKALGATDGSAVCFDVNSTCMSFLNALEIANLYLNSGQAKNVLICSSEIASVSLNPNDPLTAPLFGDAAAAMVLSGSESGSYYGSRFRSFSSGSAASQFLGAGTLHHPNSPSTTPDMNYFQMDGSSLLRFTMRYAPLFIDDFLNQIQLTRDDIDVVIPHQPSAHGLEMVWRLFKFPKEKVFVNLHKRGNCVAASIPLAFAEAAESGFLKRGDRVLMLGAAAGITFGAVALQY
jgi:3-oxoacyl-[acyl-carrier-protein] synthase-3